MHVSPHYAILCKFTVRQSRMSMGSARVLRGLGATTYIHTHTHTPNSAIQLAGWEALDAHAHAGERGTRRRRGLPKALPRRAQSLPMRNALSNPESRILHTISVIPNLHSLFTALM